VFHFAPKFVVPGEQLVWSFDSPRHLVPTEPVADYVLDTLRRTHKLNLLGGEFDLSAWMDTTRTAPPPSRSDNPVTSDDQESLAVLAQHEFVSVVSTMPAQAQSRFYQRLLPLAKQAESSSSSSLVVPAHDRVQRSGERAAHVATLGAAPPTLPLEHVAVPETYTDVEGMTTRKMQRLCADRLFGAPIGDKRKPAWESFTAIKMGIPLPTPPPDTEAL
jgi:hypothetical protein